MATELSPTEAEYAYFLQSIRTTEELMEYFGARKRAVYQVLYTLQLKRKVKKIKSAGVWKWRATKTPSSCRPMTMTPNRRAHLEYLGENRKMCDVMREFDEKECTARWSVRTLVLAGLVRRSGKGWRATEEGLQTIYVMNGGKTN